MQSISPPPPTWIPPPRPPPAPAWCQHEGSAAGWFPRPVAYRVAETPPAASAPAGRVTANPSLRRSARTPACIGRAHDLGNRVERPSAGHRTPTRGKARRADLHRAEQRHQPPGALIFEGPLRAAALAASPAAAMILRLSLNEGPATQQVASCPPRASAQSFAAHIRPRPRDRRPHERQRSHPVRPTPTKPATSS
jgi:hypothetical protein